MSDTEATLRERRLRASDGRAGVPPLTVSVAMPADLTWLPAARGFAGTAGVALDFDIDTIADLRMAVDEMVSILITRAAAGGVVTLELLAEGDRIDVSGTVTVADPGPVDQTAFGWIVLTALARDISTAIDPDAAGGAALHIELTVVADRGGS